MPCNQNSSKLFNEWYQTRTMVNTTGIDCFSLLGHHLYIACLPLVGQKWCRQLIVIHLTHIMTAVLEHFNLTYNLILAATWNKEQKNNGLRCHFSQTLLRQGWQPARGHPMSYRWRYIVDFKVSSVLWDINSWQNLMIFLIVRLLNMGYMAYFY